MTVIKYKDTSGTTKELLDITDTLARITALEKSNATLQEIVNVLNFSSEWKQLSPQCIYKKVGLLCMVQCDYVTLVSNTWKILGTLPVGYRPVMTGTTGEVISVCTAAFNRGENNVGTFEVLPNGTVKMYATVASSYWSSNIIFPCA